MKSDNEQSGAAQGPADEPQQFRDAPGQSRARRRSLTGNSDWKFRWLAQVNRDHARLPKLGMNVAYALAQTVHKEGGEAWKSQETYAKEINASDRAVRKSLDALEDRGHLEKTSGNGRRRTSTYRLILKTRNDRSAFSEPETRNDRSGFVETKKGERPSPKGGTAERERRNERSDKESRKKEAAAEDAAAQCSKQNTNDPTHFGEFMAAYARPEGRAAAWKLYRKIVREGRATENELIAGAHRTRAEYETMTGDQRLGYPWAHRWLDYEGWRDYQIKTVEVGPRPSAAPYQNCEDDISDAADIAARRAWEDEVADLIPDDGAEPDGPDWWDDLEAEASADRSVPLAASDGFPGLRAIP